MSLILNTGRFPPEIEGTVSDHTRGRGQLLGLPGTQATGGDHTRGQLMGQGIAAAALLGAAVEACITN